MLEVVVIVESAADFRTATKLAERVIVEEITWMETELFPHQFHWRGLKQETEFSCWKDVKKIIEQLAIRVPREKRRGLKSDGISVNRVLGVVEILRNSRNEQIDAVMFIRDMDGDVERPSHINHARTQFTGNQTIVIGIANRNREAWVLNGFVPDGDDEKALIADAKKRNGDKFDPTVDAHRLQEISREEPKRWGNPKVVLEHLTSKQFERERCCWEEPELSFLRERGWETGLDGYLGEVAERLVPIVVRPKTKINK